MVKIRTGVIGVGALGWHHARLYGQCDGAELVGVYDHDHERSVEVATKLGVKAFTSIDELVAAVEAISVAVPTNRHYEVVSALLNCDKHVLVEKPIAQSVDEAVALVALAEQRQLVLQVGHVERFNPVLECLQQVPGVPRFIEAHRLAGYPPLRPGLPPRGTEVSVVLDLMIHDLDVILSLVQSEIRRVDAVGVQVLSPSADIANARIEFANGCVANITASRISQEQLRKIRVFKSQAYFSLDYGAKSGDIATMENGGINRRAVPVHDSNALQDQLQDFCRCVADVQAGGKARPRVTGNDGLQALKLAEMVHASIAANIQN